MKTLFLILLALVLSNTGSFAQENVHELTFENYSDADHVDFHIYPVSMVFFHNSFPFSRLGTHELPLRIRRFVTREQSGSVLGQTPRLGMHAGQNVLK